MERGADGVSPTQQRAAGSAAVHVGQQDVILSPAPGDILNTIDLPTNVSINVHNESSYILGVKIRCWTKE